MYEFETYFTEKKIIRLIARYRISVANKRHDIHILNGIRTKTNVVNPIEATRNKIDTIILKIIPPRRKWVKFSKKNRASYENSTKLNIASLEKAILYYHKRVLNGKESQIQPWYIELQKFLKQIQDSFHNIENYNIDEPTIFPEKKEKEAEKDYIPCRPIAHYKLLSDKILIGQTAKYLTDNLDSEFYDSSVFAFRSARNKSTVITHHDTVTKIEDYINNSTGKEFWVSECDIRKFYDCVNHSYAKEALNEISIRFEKRTGAKINDKSIAIFNKYLDSYSFNYKVLPKNTSEEMLKINGKYEWAEDGLKSEFYNNGINEPIGVPQGGAISCLIANLMLDKVDRSVINFNEDEDKNLLYMRYCDDMIIIHTEKKQCTEALNRYMTSLKNCNLLCHPPILVEKYSQNFWESKSKLPYRWGKKSEGNVPWVSFVGYQIQYDGQIRIRKKSLKKEILKQKKIIDNIGYAIKIHQKENLHLNSRRTKKQIIYRAEQKLIAISVGRVNLRNLTQNPTDKPSWTIGFKKLNKNNIVEKQLKRLDRNRTHVMKKLKKHLQNLKLKNEGTGKKSTERFFGSPFSYHNFILRK
ncbi:MAG: reverse transcriptase domain-containing protein [Bacteroidota bacterium]